MNNANRQVVGGLIILAFGAIVAVLVATQPTPEELHAREVQELLEANELAARRIVHFRDERTGLCYIRRFNYTEVESWVPCTPEVLEQIGRVPIEE